MSGAAGETTVRMGELAVSRTPGHVLGSIGLGSCVGVVLVELARPMAGLAHVVLPAAGERADAPPGKFADRAVPALVQQMTALGARRSGLRAVLVGAAHMFNQGPTHTLAIGRRNEDAARLALQEAGVAVVAASTGGNQGRTVRVYVGSGRVTVRGPGTAEVDLLPARQSSGVRR